MLPETTLKTWALTGRESTRLELESARERAPGTAILMLMVMSPRDLARPSLPVDCTLIWLGAAAQPQPR